MYHSLALYTLSCVKYLLSVEPTVILSASTVISLKVALSKYIADLMENGTWETTHLLNVKVS